MKSECPDSHVEQRGLISAQCLASISTTTVCPSGVSISPSTDWPVTAPLSDYIGITLTCQRERRRTLAVSFLFFHLPQRSLLCLGKVWLNPLSGGVGKREKRERRREEGGKGDTTATICSMWPSLFSIRAAIHGMVLLITAHNTFSGMKHNLPVARWTSRVSSRHVDSYVCVCVRL